MKPFKSLLLLLAVTSALLLTACGTTHPTKSTTSTTASQQRVAFKGVSVQLPQNWQVVYPPATASCLSPKANTIFVGDIQNGGDCLAYAPTTMPFVVLASAPPESPPVTTKQIGSLQGAEYQATNQVTVIFPSQGVELNLLGLSASDLTTLLNSVKAG